jgi:hypothetical protein
VTGGNSRHGRRDNGLHAAAYASVGDVDPRIGEHLLDVLGNRGIAAYLQPTADQHPITRLTTLPGRPTDRLYVDRSELDTAREFLDILTKDPDPGDAQPDDESAAPNAAPSSRESQEFDEAWASIVAGYNHADEAETAPWPAIEEVGGATTAAPEPAREFPRWRPSGGPRPAPVDDESLLAGLDSFGGSLPDPEDDENYYPPVPPPLPRLATITIVSIIGVIAGVAIVIHPALLPIDTTAAAVFGCASVIAGLIGLVGRLRANDDDYEDPDNGAVV